MKKHNVKITPAAKNGYYTNKDYDDLMQSLRNWVSNAQALNDLIAKASKKVKND